MFVAGVFISVLATHVENFP